jgi:hypothetical protein
LIFNILNFIFLPLFFQQKQSFTGYFWGFWKGENEIGKNEKQQKYEKMKSDTKKEERT